MTTFFRRNKLPLLATSSYIVLVVFINCLYTYAPVFTIYSQRLSVADILVGSIYIVRDFAQREIRHYVLIAMLIGGVLSYLLAAKAIAIASIAAFATGECIDWAIFTFTKKPLSQRLLWSSLISAPIDSAVFLFVAARLQSLEFSIMTVAKIAGVLALWFFWKRKATTKSNTKSKNYVMQ